MSNNITPPSPQEEDNINTSQLSAQEEDNSPSSRKEEDEDQNHSTATTQPQQQQQQDPLQDPQAPTATPEISTTAHHHQDSQQASDAIQQEPPIQTPLSASTVGVATPTVIPSGVAAAADGGHGSALHHLLPSFHRRNSTSHSFSSSSSQQQHNSFGSDSNLTRRHSSASNSSSSTAAVNTNPITPTEVSIAAFQIFKTELLAYYSKHNGHLDPETTYFEHRFPQEKKARRALAKKKQEQLLEKQRESHEQREKRLEEERQFANSRLYTIGKSLSMGYMPLSLQKYQVQRYSSNLDLIKHLCRHIYPKVRLHNVDNLKTNHKGVFVIREMRMVPQYERVFMCGVMRGVLYCMTQGEVKIGCDMKDLGNGKHETVYKILMADAVDSEH